MEGHHGDDLSGGTILGRVAIWQHGVTTQIDLGSGQACSVFNRFPLSLT